MGPANPPYGVAARSLRRNPRHGVEARLLLGTQAGIKLVQRRLHLVGGLQHGGEPLLHRLQPADRRLRHAVRAGRLQDLDGVPRRTAQAFERLLLLARRMDRGIDPLDRQLRQAGLWIAAALPWRARLLLLRAVAEFVRPELVETRLLLVG